MKKMNRFSIAGLLAAGAMLFATLGCDTAVSEKEWNPETPKQYKDLEATVEGTVTAKWDFTDLSKTSAGNWASILKTSDATNAKGDTIADDTKFAPSSGTGATLAVKAGGNGFKANSGEWEDSSKNKIGVLQIQKGSTTLEKDTNKGYGNFLLTLDEAANVVIKAVSISDASDNRYVGVKSASSDGTVASDAEYIVQKGNIGKSKVIDIVMKGAPKGSYLIYSNGTCFVSIDCSVTNDNVPAKPAEISKLVLYNKAGTEEATDTSIEEITGSLSLKAYNITSTDSEDLTSDVEWTSSDKSVATVSSGAVTPLKAGTTVIRARSGRFYDQITLTVTPLESTMATFFSNENSPDADTEIGVDNWTEENAELVKKLATATVIGNFATVSDEAFEFSDEAKAMDWTDKEAPLLIKKANATGADGYKTGVMKWKNEQSTAWTDDTLFATLSFKAKPTGNSAVLKEIKFKTPTNNSNAGQYFVKAVVGSDSTDGTACAKGTATISVNKTITAETTIKVELYVIGTGNTTWTGKSGKAKSFGFNDIVAVFTE